MVWSVARVRGRLAFWRHADFAVYELFYPAHGVTRFD